MTVYFLAAKYSLKCFSGNEFSISKYGFSSKEKAEADKPRFVETLRTSGGGIFDVDVDVDGKDFKVFVIDLEIDPPSLD